MINAEYSDLTTDALKRILERSRNNMWKSERPCTEARKEYERAQAILNQFQKEVLGIEAELIRRGVT